MIGSADIEELLHQHYAVSRKDLEKAKRFQADFGGRLEQILVNLGVITEEAAIDLLAKHLSIEFLSADDIYDQEDLGRLNPAQLPVLNYDFLAQRQWIPFQLDTSGCLAFAAVDPLDEEANEYLATQNLKYRIAICTTSLFRELEFRFSSESLTDNISHAELSDHEVHRLREMASEAPTVALVNSLISRGMRMGASDLHLEPLNGMYRVRLRIDGVLHDIEYLPEKAQLPVASRLKILAGMDIAEKRRPQDGKISTRVAGSDLDIRVSSAPLVEGESIVLRFLPKEAMKFELEELGIASDTLSLIHEDLSRTSGVILMTGPTGSGKTTTLYSFLNKLNTSDLKIITLEDPVEYRLQGINQIQVNSEIGYDFAKGLRSIVRQDPDVIMLGEIRDAETAQIAIQSALTGHLVFSTVHTNNAPATYSRLLDLGVDEFLLDAGLVSIIAQRLVRKNCTHCQQEDPQAQHFIDQYHLNEFCQRFQLPQPQLKRSIGCKQCAHSGYLGRVALIEYLRCNRDIAALPKNKDFESRAYDVMDNAGRRRLFEDGLAKVVQGITTVEEVLREVG